MVLKVKTSSREGSRAKRGLYLPHKIGVCPIGTSTRVRKEIGWMTHKMHIIHNPSQTSYHTYCMVIVLIYVQWTLYCMPNRSYEHSSRSEDCTLYIIPPYTVNGYTCTRNPRHLKKERTRLNNAQTQLSTVSQN